MAHIENLTAGASVLGDIGGQTQLLIAGFNASISGIVITDPLQIDNPIIYCNKAFEEMTGYSAEEVLGKNCRFLQGADREQIGRYLLHDAFANNEECKIEIANYRKDGTIFYNELYISPIKDNSGTVTNYIGIQNDITIRKIKETSLLLELANAKKLQEEKNEFISLAGDELSRPIAALGQTLQTMESIAQSEKTDDPQLAILIDNAKTHVEELALSVKHFVTIHGIEK